MHQAPPDFYPYSKISPPYSFGNTVIIKSLLLTVILNI